jgi:hypothetical protein
MSDLRFTIVSNDPDRALADALKCASTNKPYFVTLLSDPFDIDRMQDGVKCTGLFYSRRSPALDAFRGRRALGGLVGLSVDDLEWIDDWVKLHLEACAERMRRYPSQFVETIIDPGQSVLTTRDKPELENLILTQRWS